MTQLPINLNDATIRQKLQGMSKYIVIVTSWPPGALFKNWEYVVILIVRARNALYLFEEIDTDNSFKPSDELSRFFVRAKQKQKYY